MDVFFSLDFGYLKGTVVLWILLLSRVAGALYCRKPNSYCADSFLVKDNISTYNIHPLPTRIYYHFGPSMKRHADCAR